MKKYRLLFCLAISTAALSVTGCETVKGVGQDLENAGESLQKAMD